MAGSFPRFLHALTGIHAIGALACFVMAVGSAASGSFREALVVSGGSELMVEFFGRGTWAFLVFVGSIRQPSLMPPGGYIRGHGN